MAAMSDYLEAAILDHITGTTALTAPTSVYVALYTTATTDAGGGTEVAAGVAYVRTLATFSAAVSPGGVITTSLDVTFPQATGSWGTVTHLAVHDAQTAGNMLFHGALTTSKLISNLDTFKIPAGSLTLTIA